jgi:N4-(beta-N-acetylglucosaminyl)-L-asparaginase
MLLVRALLGLSMLLPGSCASLPVVVNTWPFVNATAAAYDVLVGSAAQHRLAVSAVEAGCSTCEQQQCDGTVGYGGSPDEGGETTLDAMVVFICQVCPCPSAALVCTHKLLAALLAQVMDGTTMEAGAVSSLRFIKQAARAARLVLEHTRHTMLAGMQATQFAVGMGLASSSLTTPHSAAQHDEWCARQGRPRTCALSRRTDGASSRTPCLRARLLQAGQPLPTKLPKARAAKRGRVVRALLARWHRPAARRAPG